MLVLSPVAGPLSTCVVYIKLCNHGMCQHARQQSKVPTVVDKVSGASRFTGPLQPEVLKGIG